MAESLPADLSIRRRTVWAWADAHIGHREDGKDAGRWAELATDDLVENVGAPDYVLMLGDTTHAYTEAQFRRYARLRRRSGVARWYEIVGNHDYHGTETGLYQKYVRPERHYVVVDGNLCWVMVSAERGRAAGILRAPVRRWLKAAVAKHQDKNLVVCTHQVIPRTVRRSHPKKDFERVLNPAEWIADLRRHHRIDGWLFGHEHGPPRDAGQAVRSGRTTFINVASLSHVYNTQACNSFWLELRAGGRAVRARCRHHDAGRFVPEFEVEIPLPFPVKLSRQPVIADVLGRRR